MAQFVPLPAIDFPDFEIISGPGKFALLCSGLGAGCFVSFLLRDLTQESHITAKVTVSGLRLLGTSPEREDWEVLGTCSSQSFVAHYRFGAKALEGSDIRGWLKIAYAT